MTGDLRLFPGEPIRAIDGRVVPQAPANEPGSLENSPRQGGTLDSLTRQLNQGRKVQAQHDRATRQWLARSNRAHAQAARVDLQRRLYMGKILTR